MFVVTLAPDVGNFLCISSEDSMNHEELFSCYCYLGVYAV